jgi:uncharacterized membrane protein
VLLNSILLLFLSRSESCVFLSSVLRCIYCQWRLGNIEVDRVIGYTYLLIHCNGFFLYFLGSFVHENNDASFRWTKSHPSRPKGLLVFSLKRNQVEIACYYIYDNNNTEIFFVLHVVIILLWFLVLSIFTPTVTVSESPLLRHSCVGSASNGINGFVTTNEGKPRASLLCTVFFR